MPAFSEIDNHVLSNSIPLTIWHVDRSSIPLFLTTKSQIWPTSEWKLFGVCCKVHWIRYTIFFISWSSRYNVIEHGHEDGSSLKLLRFTIEFCHHLLNLIEKSQCSDSLEICPLEFNLFSINLIQFFEIACFQIPFNFVLPGLNWFSGLMPPKHSTESEKTWTSDFIIRTSLSHNRDDCPHKLIPVTRGQSCDLRLSAPQTSKIDSWRIVNSSMKCDRHIFSPHCCVHIDVFQIILLHVKYTVWWYMEMMGPNSTSEFRIFCTFWNFGFSWTSLVFATSFSLCWWTVEHLFANLENSALRLDCNFDLRLHQASLIIQPVDLKLWVSLGISTHSVCPPIRTGQVHHHWPGFSHNSVLFWLFLHPFRHHFGETKEAEILGAAKRAEMADVEQTEKIIPFVPCEVSFCQFVCHLVFGVNGPYQNLKVQVNSVTQPIKRNSVGSWHMSHSWTPALDYHFDHGFIVFKHEQCRSGLRKFDVRKHTINVKQFKIIVLGWNYCLILLSCSRHDAMPQVSLCWWIHGFTRLVLVAMKHLNH